jgi:hypothetical protein
VISAADSLAAGVDGREQVVVAVVVDDARSFLGVREGLGRE